MPRFQVKSNTDRPLAASVWTRPKPRWPDGAWEPVQDFGEGSAVRASKAPPPIQPSRTAAGAIPHPIISTAMLVEHPPAGLPNPGRPRPRKPSWTQSTGCLRPRPATGRASIGAMRRLLILIYHRRGSEPSSSALSLEPTEAPMHTPIPTPDLAAFLALMGLLAVIATLANA